VGSLRRSWGRESELELLENTFARTVRDRRASLFTLYGDPGVGKSRLAREFVAGVEGATVLMGRCLPYGEGVTYWPLAEMVKASAGITDDDPLDTAQEKLRACCEDEAVADLLGLAVGVLEAVEGERGQQEIAWAARTWTEQLAQAQPLVLVFEDVHWGEEPLLELIEHLAASVRVAPLLLLCLARSELLDVRPGWGGGRVRATAIELEPLQPEESAQLVAALTAELELPVDAVGRLFMCGALEHLSPEMEDVEGALEELVARDLVVREARATISGEVAFKRTPSSTSAPTRSARSGSSRRRWRCSPRSRRRSASSRSGSRRRSRRGSATPARSSAGRSSGSAPHRPPAARIRKRS
jgi:hypothetical protein